MIRDRLFSARLRCFRFHFIYHCEPLEARLLFSGEARDLTAMTIAAEWGVAAIQAPDVWTEGYTGRGVTVAVVDTGVALAHPDLSDRLWTNSDEVPGNNRDDDANGFVDDSAGWDFLDADNRPDDPAGHGTHIAGIIAAGTALPDESAPSGAGESLGVAPEARVMPIRVLDGNLRGANREIAAGIRYAVDNGADIINLSIGGAENSAIRSAIEYAGEHDVLVVAAAGNDRSDKPGYPAAHSASLDNVLSAGAFRENGDREPSSNLVGTSGAVQVDAPGQAIRSTFVTAKYGYQSGTSMAAPHVAGLAALLLSADPSLSAADLRTIIVDAANPAAAGSDSAGSVNAMDAIALALESLPTAFKQPISQESGPLAPSPPIAASPPTTLPPPINSVAPEFIAPASAIIRQPLVSITRQSDVLIMPPTSNVPSGHTSSSSPALQSEPARHSETRTASQVNERSMCDAALLAYRVDTGGSAMSWPLEEADQPVPPEGRKPRKPAPTASAAAAGAARPRPDAGAAEKTAAR